MDKIEYQAVIKYFLLKGNTPTQIKDELDSVYGDSVPSFTTVKFWTAEFKRGRNSLGDDERSGRPSTATTDENITEVHQMVLDDRRIKRLLRLDQKRVRMNISNDLLEQFRLNKTEFWRRLIIVETWIHHYTLGTKIQFKQWTAKGTVSKKAKTVFPAGKVMATVFRDSHGVILIDYLQKGKTITGPYNASLHDKLKAELVGKRSHLQKKENLLHQHNVPSHLSGCHGELCVCIGLSGTDYAIAVCTPLMKRAHSLVESGSMVYIEACESPGNKERSEHYVLLMLAHTAAGGAPLWSILCTNSNSAAVLTLGFQLLKQLLPEHAFYCRSESGPYACMIEDSESPN
ncbi:histone-lysine N-methyltransferase SETMAR [Trichonephila clavipes]|nr:histone-lysine N-methyltransferase SETMAR [Trichonephila clavipes]